jgi:thiosulfate dehydrogenase (quinone) large subunit
MNGNAHRKNDVVGLTLTGIRVGLGLFWLLQLTWKPPPTFGCPNEGFCLWLNNEIHHPLIPLYADFLAGVIRPNVILFGWFTTVAEVSIGLSLFFGALTRLGALVGTLWSVNLLIGLAAVPNEQPWYYILMILLNLVFVAIGASGQISVDRARNWRMWWGRAAQSIA